MIGNQIRDNFQFKEHQRHAIKELMNMPRAVISFSTGSGKTITFLSAFALCRKFNLGTKAIIVCDKSSVVSIIEDIEGKTNLSYQFIDTKDAEDHVDEVDLLLCTYNRSVNFLHKIDLSGYSHIIFDEAHMLANPESKTVKSLSEIKRNFQYIWFSCVVAGSLCLTNLGYKKIEDMIVGDRVWSRSGWNNVTQTHKYSKVPVLKVTTQRGFSLTCTPNHKFLVGVNKRQIKESKFKGVKTHIEYDWEYKEALNLLSGDIVRMSDGVKGMESPYQKCFLDLKGSRKSRLDGRKWNFLDEDLALFLGMIHGDGFLDKRTVNVLCSLKELNDMECCLKNIFKIEKWPFPFVLDNKEGTCFRTRICSKILVDFIDKLGCKRGSKNKVIPDIILRSPKSVIAAYLRGLFSTDGTVFNDGLKGVGIALSSSSEETVIQVQLLLEDIFGIRTCVSKVDNSKNKSYGGGVAWILKIVGKRKKFLRIGFIYKSKMKTLSFCRDIKGKEIFERVKNVKFLGNQDVYDLSVENDPSYTVNGFITHNTATLMSNDIMDLWGMFNFIYPALFGSDPWVFKNKYCILEEKEIRAFRRGAALKYERYGKQSRVKMRIQEVVGYQNLEDLAEKIKPFVLFHTIDHDIKTHFIDVYLTDQEKTLYKVASSGFEDRKLRPDDIVPHSVRMHDLQLTIDCKGSNYFTPSKQIALGDYLATNEMNGSIVFFSYKESLRESYESFEKEYQIEQITGDTSSSERKRIKGWLGPGNFLFMTDAGAQSLNLDSVNNILFFDTPYAIKSVSQVIGRIVRMSSPYKEFHVHFLKASGTIDEYKVNLISTHAYLIKLILDGYKNLPDIKYHSPEDMKALKRTLLWTSKKSKE